MILVGLLKLLTQLGNADRSKLPAAAYTNCADWESTSLHLLLKPPLVEIGSRNNLKAQPAEGRRDILGIAAQATSTYAARRNLKKA